MPSGARLRLAFAGTPQASAQVLSALLAQRRHRVEWVLTAPDRPAGRGRKMRPSPVKQCAQQHQLSLLQTTSPAHIDTARLARLDLLVVVAYGVLLPPEVLAVPRWGSLNLHFSLLPRWRGAAPVQHAILAGDQKTGVSLMQIDAGLDTGPLYQQIPCTISRQDCAATLLAKLTAIASTSLLSCLDRFAEQGQPAQPAPQQGPGCRAPRISTRQAWIDWRQDAEAIDRQIRAFNPTPVARTRWGQHILRIWEARPVADSTARAAAGEVLQCDKHGLVIMTGKRALQIHKLQAAGKRVMTAADFINGIPAPSALGKFVSDAASGI